jgi:hypothetical protein
VSAERVLATGAALEAARRLHASLSGDLRGHLRRVVEFGKALADPGEWDGPEVSVGPGPEEGE